MRDAAGPADARLPPDRIAAPACSTRRVARNRPKPTETNRKQPKPAAPPAQAEGPTGSTLFGPWPESMLLQPAGPARAARLAAWRSGRRATAMAMYPPVMGHSRDQMPCLWTAEEWAAAAAATEREPIFDAAAFEAQMNEQAGSFERDGVVVLRCASPRGYMLRRCFHTRNDHGD
eukprot:SAG31_NODE_8119_length_1518_cov_2.211416_2_plen_175_part_00